MFINILEYILDYQIQIKKGSEMGMAGFEPESHALEARILAKLYYIPDMKIITIRRLKSLCLR
jgi:hypothetical protein